MNILGISCYYHDAAGALLREGVLVAAVEEERFSRRKHDRRFPRHSIQFCLDQAGLQVGDLDYVVFYEKPFRKLERIVQSCLQTFPRSRRLFVETMDSYVMDKLSVGKIIARELGVPDSKILYSSHHMSHAASSFFCSPFQEAAILTVDGVGEWTTTALGTGQANDLSFQKEIRFPHSLGLLYSVFTAWLGFEVNEGEYKVMGMAPYGVPRYIDKVRKLIHLSNDGSFWLDMSYFSFHHSVHEAFNGRFTGLFGPPRPSGSNFFTAGTDYPSYFGERPTNFAALADGNQYYADVAASLQKVVEEALLGMARMLHRDTGLDDLCMAGGVALNSVANGRILRETPFKRLYVQPAATDAGGALGSALYAHHVILAQPRIPFVMDHAYWGQSYGDSDVVSFLRSNSISHTTVSSEDELVDHVADALQAGQVVGWFQGGFEWGPRALGNRSILGDPRRPEMKDVVNVKIKFREPYRPFAPSVLAEKAAAYFDLDEHGVCYPTDFMLLVVPVLDSAKTTIPAVTHVDGTARVQTVNRRVAPLYHRLIEQFGQATGIPVVMNTSFNLRGEPIVNKPEEAYKTFMRSGLDLLVLGDRLVRKK